MNFGSDRKKKWKDIWGSGQGIGLVDKVQPAAGLIARLQREYYAARGALALPSPMLNPAWARELAPA
jgi:nitronate monooxygenase